MTRNTTRVVYAGPVGIGGGLPIPVQTMVRTPLTDPEGMLGEINAAAHAGCDIIRIAVPNAVSAHQFGRIAARSPIPVVADTHFDWRTTIACLREGAAKVRINPGNMNPDGLARVVELAGEKGIPIRIGGNSGSILHRREDRPDKPLAKIMADELIEWAGAMERLGFRDIVLSLKANNAADTVAANRLAATMGDYPLHLGVTAAGPFEDSLMKSAAAMGSLLLDGIGDTIRFSFTGDMLGEVKAGRQLLSSLRLDHSGLEIISCPGCGRCRVDLRGLVDQVKLALTHIQSPLRVAVMGCEVNGPGEAKEADFGLASAGGILHLFSRGKTIATVPAETAVAALVKEVEAFLADT